MLLDSVTTILRRLIRRELRPSDPPPPGDPYSWVRQPVHRGPSSRSAGVALDEPCSAPGLRDFER
jgi:hypothetical protein